VESPWQSCDRCLKHKLRCEITADFKRVGKRSQQAELERNNEILSQQVEELSKQLAAARERETELRMYEMQLRRQIDERNQMAEFTSTPPQHHDDGSNDAALLLNLKQSASDGPGAHRVTPLGRTMQLGNVTVYGDTVDKLWEEYFSNYHTFLPVLDRQQDSPDVIKTRSNFLFWTVIMVAARHFEDDPNLLARLTLPYSEHLKNTISMPPSKDQHHTVKALCLLCTWPLPVENSTADMTFTLSGIMMKFAMHLGIHRPSNPSDFNIVQVDLRAEEITDRLKTWAICNLVAQNVSTGYGQPPETVYDATLQIRMDESSRVLAYLHPRLEIEKFADKVTREMYCPQENPSSHFHESPMNAKATVLSSMLKQVEDNTDLNNRECQMKVLLPTTNNAIALDSLYFCAARMHLKLQVFFEKHDSPRYQFSLGELFNAVKDFLTRSFNCGVELRYAPNYIMQMLTAAAVALLKLLNSFFGFAPYIERDAGEQLFWQSIAAIRKMSVRTNDLPQRLAEVFAQMWNAWDTNSNEGAQVSESVSNGVVDESLTLKRRYRMSMSHVFDSIWRWKDELHGNREDLIKAVKNPTSPIAMTHRSSFSNGRRPSSSLVDENNNADLQGMTSFGGFGGVPLAGQTDMTFATSYDYFDPLGWYLNDIGPMDGFGVPTTMGWGT
jgi:hypothetical protein